MMMNIEFLVGGDVFDALVLRHRSTPINAGIDALVKQMEPTTVGKAEMMDGRKVGLKLLRIHGCVRDGVGVTGG